MSKKQIGDTVQALFNSFIRERELYQKAPSTVINYKATFKALCKRMPGVESKPIGAIDKRFIVNYLESLTSASLAVATINHNIRDLKVFIYWCMENDYIVPFKIKCLKDNTPMKTPYTREEVCVLLRKPLPTDDFATWRSWAIVNLVLGCGVRAMTITNMKIQDIDHANNLIFLRHNKDGKPTTLPLVPQLKKALVAYERHHIGDTDVLFPARGGTMLSINGLREGIMLFNKDRGVNQTSVHLLRHTFGTMWAENGGDVYELQRFMTHKDIRTTQNYINLYGRGHDASRAILFNPLENL